MIGAVWPIPGTVIANSPPVTYRLLACGPVKGLLETTSPTSAQAGASASSCRPALASSSAAVLATSIVLLCLSLCWLPCARQACVWGGADSLWPEVTLLRRLQNGLLEDAAGCNERPIIMALALERRARLVCLQSVEMGRPTAQSHRAALAL